MSALFALRLITYLLVCAGVAALALAGLLGPMGGTILALALIGSWVIDQVRDRMPVRPLFSWAIVVAAAVAIALDLLYLAQSFLDGMVHVLLFLILFRLFRRRSLKDLRDAGFLSFFMLVAASAVTFNVSFFFVFIAFLLLGTWMLILHHVVAESERARTGLTDLTGGGIGPRSPPFRVSLAAAAGTGQGGGPGSDGESLARGGRVPQDHGLHLGQRPPLDVDLRRGRAAHQLIQ